TLSCVICVLLISVCCIFFFSSRRRHTRFSRDWSSDVCSSDLYDFADFGSGALAKGRTIDGTLYGLPFAMTSTVFFYRTDIFDERSEERRVGKECISRWSTYHQNKSTSIGSLSPVSTRVSDSYS